MSRLRAVDPQLGAGDVVGIIGGEEVDQLCDLVGRTGLACGQRDNAGGYSTG